jgi:hypothetical protein
VGAPGGAGLRRGDVPPVDVGAPEREVPAGDADRLAVVGAAGFEEGDGDGGVGREAVGQGAPRPSPAPTTTTS